jgi:hypothetical protein
MFWLALTVPTACWPNVKLVGERVTVVEPQARQAKEINTHITRESLSTFIRTPWIATAGQSRRNPQIFWLGSVYALRPESPRSGWRLLILGPVSIPWPSPLVKMKNFAAWMRIPYGTEPPTNSLGNGR